MPRYSLGIDYDNCLDHNERILLYAAVAQKDKEGTVITANKELLEALIYNLISYDVGELYIASNRQSPALDALNAKENGTGSCFPAMKLIADHLGMPLVPLLLSDIFTNVPEGTSYQRAMEPGYVGAKDAAPFDRSKILLTYTHLHHAYHLHPGEDLIYHFIDDRYSILQNLKAYYKKFSFLIPSNVTLRLSRYSGVTIFACGEIRGKGTFDPQYRQTVIDLFLQAVKFAPPEQTSIDVAKHSDPLSLPAFASLNLPSRQGFFSGSRATESEQSGCFTCCQ